MACGLYNLIMKVSKYTQQMQTWQRWIPFIAGGLEAVLIARFLARLLAARPDHPIMQALYQLSAPLIWPLTPLDAQQPRFGAIMEISTLTMIGLVPLLAYLLWLLTHPTLLRATSDDEAAS